ncbi:MAG: ECF transporter S component [Coriobacteriia bacterium]|nr:ECF transporter S component [Coriobacteriia bacterium]
MKETENSMAQAQSQKRRFTTYEIVIVAIFTAIALIVSFIEIPIMPAAPWLKYDPSGSVALIVGFLFGPTPGSLVAILSWLPRIFTNPIGVIMNILGSLAIVIPSAMIYRKLYTMDGTMKALIVGIICSLTISILVNFIATPLYYGGTVMDVVKMIIPILIPFNLIKLVANSGIALLVYKPISNMVKKPIKANK